MPDDHQPRTILRRGMADHDWQLVGAEDHSASSGTWPGAEAAPTADSVPSGRWFRRLKIIVFGIAGGVAVMLLFHASLQSFEANGQSMEPTLHDGDRLIINRLAYTQVDLGILDGIPAIDPDARWTSPARGDVIVFYSPIFNIELVKRVIGLPGERIEVRDSQVYVDGQLLDEPYARGPTRCRRICDWTVPDRNYFVLGDNRTESRDSREGWTVPIGDIDGEKLVSY